MCQEVFKAAALPGRMNIMHVGHGRKAHFRVKRNPSALGTDRCWGVEVVTYWPGTTITCHVRRASSRLNGPRSIPKTEFDDLSS